MGNNNNIVIEESNKNIKLVENISISPEYLSILIGKLFKDFKNKEMNPTDKKALLIEFEDIIKCLRRKILGVKDLYNKQSDDIEILVELSETFDIVEKFKNLVEDYNNVLNKKIYINKVNIYTQNEFDSLPNDEKEECKELEIK